jgi:hypothetical protein
MIIKKFKTYVFLGNLGLSLGKFIVSEEVDLSLGNDHVLGEKELKLLWGTT